MYSREEDSQIQMESCITVMCKSSFANGVVEFAVWEIRYRARTRLLAGIHPSYGLLSCRYKFDRKCDHATRKVPRVNEQARGDCKHRLRDPPCYPREPPPLRRGFRTYSITITSLSPSLNTWSLVEIVKRT